MKRMSILPLVIISVAITASAADTGKRKHESDLQQLARIAPDSAQTLALQKAPGKILESDLEIENGVLLYSYDIQTKDNTIMGIQINAKDGSVVSAKEEAQAGEKAGEKAEKKETEVGKEEKGEKAKIGAGEKKESEEVEEKAGESADKGEWIGTIRVKAMTNLDALAKINQDQADSAALKLVEGTVKKTELANEDGYLVFKVTVDLNGKNYEALVDAGNGKVLEIKSHE
jgi:uncharacterized membrane protein YkoI